MKLNLSPNEFADLVASFLFDKMLKPDKVVPNNEMFNEFIDKMIGKGAKSLCSTHEIRILPEDKKDKKDKKEKGGLVRKAIKIVKKLLRKEDVSKEELNLLLETVEKEE